MVILYVKDNCSRCTMIEKALIRKNIKTVIKSLDNEDVLIHLVSDGAMLTSAPIMYYEGKYINDLTEMSKIIEKEEIKNAGN